MKKITIIFIILYLSSCQSTKEKNETQKEITPSNEITHEHTPDDLPLNDGAKWKVDDSMLVYSRNMESSIDNFKLVHDNSFIQLTETLLSNIHLLTSNCTMKDKTHNELLKFPTIDLVNQLAASKIKSENIPLHLKLKESFIIFHQFFY